MPKYTATFEYEGYPPTNYFMENFLRECGFSRFSSVNLVIWEITSTQTKATVTNAIEATIATNGTYTRGRLTGVNVIRGSITGARDEAIVDEVIVDEVIVNEPTATASASVRALASTGARDRASLQTARRLLEPGAAETLLDVNQKPWNLLYGAIVNSIGVNPKNFQMVYPFTSWNWKTQQPGFIGSDQYDFCSTVPQWSAVGNYSSSGDRFNFAYQEFLNIILAASDDPNLRRQIDESRNALTKATNEYTVVYNQAVSVYSDDPAVKDNVPSFSEWLGTPAGKGWQTQIKTAETNVDQAQRNYDAVVSQAQTPGLEAALQQFKNTEFYSKLTDPGLATFPKVPNWSVSQNAAEWVDRIKAGEGPAGASMGFANRDSAYDYSRTWAGGSASITQFFWQVQVKGKWERVTEFETDNELVVSVEFEAVDQIGIQPSDWYNGPFVRSKANGPFIKGYSSYGSGGTQAIFGQTGFINLLKTGMFVCYKPTFTITTSKSTFNSFLEKFEVSTGLRIGPFSFSASGGSQKAGWNASKTGQSFSGTSTSDTPLIFGVSIAQLPNSDDESQLSSLETESIESTGVCYRFSDCRGDVLGHNVTKSDCFNYLGGGSWKQTGTTRCWEN